MPLNDKWSVLASFASQMTTELNGLANGSSVAQTGSFDNGTTLAKYAAFRYTGTFGSSPTAGSLINLYILPQLDGANYPDAIAGASPLVSPDLQKAWFWLRAVTTAQIVDAWSGGSPSGIITLPPCRFKLFVINNSGQALPSGSTISMLAWGSQLV